MTADPQREDETEHVGQARAVKAINSVIPTVGGIMAIAQLIVFIQSDKFNLILSATSVLMIIVGIVVLLTLDKRRSALMVSAVMSAILLSALGAVFFTRSPESGSFAIPSHGQQVSGKSLFAAGSVEGTSATLLCIVKDGSGNYFPHPTQNTNGQWTAIIGIGPQKINRPLSFTLILSTASPSAVEEFRIREQADPEYNEHGLGTNFPGGIKPLAEVEIVRSS